MKKTRLASAEYDADMVKKITFHPKISDPTLASKFDFQNASTRMFLGLLDPAGSISMRYGSGSFYNQAEIERKT
jgi:hypothetical protein